MAIKKYYPNVFSPVKVGNMLLKNRIQYAPTVCCLNTKTGEVTNDFVEYIETQSKTGVSLLTLGATSVDDETGTDFRGEVSITSDADIPGLARLAEAAHRFGAKISVEMCHAGRGAMVELLRTPEAWAPSNIPTSHGSPYIHEMNRHDMEHVIHQYVDCALRLKKSGFDMVMIHAAHGNLLAQFLSPLTNHRNDNYGGTLENRIRFPIEVIKAMRENVGKDFPMEIRVSADEMVDGGMQIDETIVFLKRIEQYVDLVNVSAGLIVDASSWFNTMPPYYKPYMHNVHWGEMVKKELTIPVATVGSIKTIEMAEEILASGKADIVSMARAFMTDSDILKKAYRGEPSENCRPCLRCFQGCDERCSIGAPLRCSVNPALCQEAKYGTIHRARSKKKVMVIGGGISGMMAAQTLVARGHNVILYEKSNELGGHLKDICHLPFKDDLKQYWKWDIKTTMECGAKIIFGTEVTPEIVEAEAPDAIFIAVGSKLITPPIPGIDGGNVYDVISVDSGNKKIEGKQVVVCGAGISGMECALGLAMEGKDVTVVDQVPVEKFGGDMYCITLDMLKHELRKYNVKFVGDSKVMKITDKGIQLTDRDWNIRFLETDAIVTAFGLESNRKDVEALSELVYETYIIGDCGDTPKNILQANQTAFSYAFEC